MSNQQHSKQQNRPSLYEARGTTTAFSILGAAQPLGWSKQKSIGLSIISFIAGGVLSGSAVGLMKSTDQSSAPIPELTTSTIPKSIPESTPKSNPVPSIMHQTDDSQVNHLPKVSNTAPIKNPLASFKADDIQKTIRLKTNHQKAADHSELIAKGDVDLQKLIEKKTQRNAVAVAPINITNNRVGGRLLETSQVQDKVTANALKKDKTKSNSSVSMTHAAALQRKPLSHDKDVLLVKSMLDTMDHPLAVNITTKTESSDDSH